MSRIASTTAPEGAVIPERHPKAPEIGTKIPSHFGHCFGCGELHPTGLHLVAHAGAGADFAGAATGAGAGIGACGGVTGAAAAD